MKNKGLKAFLILLPAVLMILACCIPVTTNSKDKTYVYVYEGDDNYSATITIHAIYDKYDDDYSYRMDYDGDDDFALSQHHLTVTDKLMSYSKTLDGDDYYYVSLPSPFNDYYWVLSSDKQTLRYATYTFHLQ